MRNYWNISTGVSLALHAIVLTGLPAINIPTPPQKNIAKEIEIFPEKIEKIVTKKTLEKHKTPPPFLKNKLINKLIAKNKKTVSLAKPKVTETNLRKVELSNTPQDKDLENIPAYVDYYNLIRNRIQRNAYYYYDSSKEGKVILNFKVLNDGSLGNASLNATLGNNSFLKKIALKSVKDAAPFPAFPDELSSYPGIQFNINIYFKNN
ncbi:MAG: TonB family protein [Candidatus Omnitrophica bacterium]|nr:TonB family protein [Candidatus Omnitrophota bacterium]